MAIRGNAQRGAFQRGMLAHAAGRTLDRANPYSRAAPTFERGLWLRWRQGFDHALRLAGEKGCLDLAERWEATGR